MVLPTPKVDPTPEGGPCIFRTVRGEDVAVWTQSNRRLEADRRRILDSRDLEELRRWTDRAFTVRSVDEL